MAAKAMEEILQLALELPREEQELLMQRLRAQLDSNADGAGAAAEEKEDQRREEAAIGPDTQPRKGKMPEWAAYLIEMGKQLEAKGVRFPSDFAEEHDHYIYGTPKRKRDK